MKLPIIKHITQFIEANDEDYVIETIEVLENLTELSSLKDEELDIIGELLSNMYGALEVQKLIKAGTPQKEALNTFMQRVLGAIDKYSVRISSLLNYVSYSRFISCNSA